MKLLTANYGTRKIAFALERRAVKSLTITVQPNCAVKVVAPLHADDAEIVKRVTRRGRWIVRQIESIKVELPAPPQPSYRTGESLRYLGRQYRLRVITAATGARSEAVLSRACIEVRVPGRPNKGTIENLITVWFKEKAKTILHKRFAGAVEMAKTHGLSAGPLRLRVMPKRWGSCVKGGAILLNPDLIKTPTDCIDYVICHELCHRKHHAHSRAFYRLLTRLMPDWQRRKAKLERCRV